MHTEFFIGLRKENKEMEKMLLFILKNKNVPLTNFSRLKAKMPQRKTIRGLSITTWTKICPYLTTPYLPLFRHFLHWSRTKMGLSWTTNTTHLVHVISYWTAYSRRKGDEGKGCTYWGQRGCLWPSWTRPSIAATNLVISQEYVLSLYIQSFSCFLLS